MATNIANQVPFLRVQRLFPQEMQQLTIEVDRSYTDIASAVNARTIGIFTTNNSVQTGETWYQNGIRYEGFRRFYPFTAAGNIPHGINTDNIFAFVKIYGTYTDGSNWYPLPYVDTALVANQVSISVTPTNIVITAGASSPPITQGYLVLEWLSLARNTSL